MDCSQSGLSSQSGLTTIIKAEQANGKIAASKAKFRHRRILPLINSFVCCKSHFYFPVHVKPVDQFNFIVRIYSCFTAKINIKVIFYLYLPAIKSVPCAKKPLCLQVMFRLLTCCGYLMSSSLLGFSTPLIPDGNDLLLILVMLGTLVHSSILAGCPSDPGTPLKKHVK